MQRVTMLQLLNQVDYINRVHGLEKGKAPYYAIDLYDGKHRLVKVLSEGGCQTNISMLQTRRELLNFLQGYVACLDAMHSGFKLTER